MQRRSFFLGLALSLTFLFSCGDDSEGSETQNPPDPPAPEAPDYTERGPSAVAVATTSLTDTTRGRTLPVEVWYPNATEGVASPVLDFESEPERQSVLEQLLGAAPAACVASTTGATRDAEPIAGNYPVVLYSHCYGCARWSAHVVMERLASHGFVVVAPDHSGDTLFEGQLETLMPIDGALVALRVADIRFVLDRVLAGDVLPAGVEPDASRVGMFGHSIGSVTAGGVAQADDRIAAVAGLAAPMDNPVTPGVSIEAIDIPLALLIATEDNSVGEGGNIISRNNFEAANTPAYKMEIVDAGHWSVTNIAGITEAYAPGCGEGLRQQSDEPFTYIPVDRANDLTASFVTAFFAAHLDADEEGLGILTSDPWPSEAPIVFRD